MTGVISKSFLTGFRKFLLLCTCTRSRVWRGIADTPGAAQMTARYSGEWGLYLFRRRVFFSQLFIHCSVFYTRFSLVVHPSAAAAWVSTSDYSLRARPSSGACRAGSPFSRCHLSGSWRGTEWSHHGGVLPLQHTTLDKCLQKSFSCPVSGNLKPSPIFVEILELFAAFLRNQQNEC